MKDLFNNLIEVGDTVACGKGQSKTLLVGKVSKLNAKTVSIESAAYNKRLVRHPREVVVMPERKEPKCTCSGLGPCVNHL